MDCTVGPCGSNTGPVLFRLAGSSIPRLLIAQAKRLIPAGKILQRVDGWVRDQREQHCPHWAGEAYSDNVEPRRIPASRDWF